MYTIKISRVYIYERFLSFGIKCNQRGSSKFLITYHHHVPIHQVYPQNQMPSNRIIHLDISVFFLHSNVNIQLRNQTNPIFDPVNKYLVLDK